MKLGKGRHDTRFSHASPSTPFRLLFQGPPARDLQKKNWKGMRNRLLQQMQVSRRPFSSPLSSSFLVDLLQEVPEGTE